MTMQDDIQAYEHHKHEDEPEGAAAKRKTLITTGLTGTVGTLIALGTHGPAGLFFGVLGTAAALALEGHGTPEEYAAVARSLGPAFRWITQGRAHPQDDRRSLHAAPIQREEPFSEMEASRPRTPYLVLPKSGGETSRLSPASSFFTLSDVLWRGFVPSLDRLYLATLDDGREVFVPANRLCHVALAGATRGGKGHIKRSLMAQLCYAGAEVYLLDPHYTRYDRESRDPLDQPAPEDWTPYTLYLQNDPAELIPVGQKYRVIEAYLQAALRELEQRLERYGHSLPVGRPLFLFLDEVPAIVDHLPQAPKYLKTLLREGAKVGVNVVTLAQDYLVKTLFPGDDGAVRDCYRTVLYVGGDATTARILLDMPAREVPEQELGRGRVMLRCDSVRPAARARVPYVDNPALYALLGPSTYVPMKDEDAGWPVDATTGPQLRPTRAAAATPSPLRHAEVHLDLPSGATPPVIPPRRYHTHGVGREAQRVRMRERERRLHSRETGEPMEQQATPIRPEDTLTAEERKVLEAYSNGEKSGNAIAAVTGIPSYRVNQILHALSRRNLIDWQPRKS